MSDQEQRPQRTKNALDEFKLRLMGDKQQGAEKAPMLALMLIGNNPRIDVYTNVPGDKDNGIIRAAMDAPVFFTLMDLLETAIGAEPGHKDYVENKGRPRDKTQRGLELISKTVVGKDKDGVVYISVVSADESRPRIKFNFKPSYYHSFINGATGQPYSPGEISVKVARSYLRLWSALVPAIMNTHFKEPDKSNWQGKGGGGGGNWKNNNGGGQNRGGGYGNKPKAQDDFAGGGSDGNWEDSFPM